MQDNFYKRKSSYAYDLPPELIAQKPAEPRDASRLLVCGRDGSLRDERFFRIIEYLNRGDVLVLNHSKVIPARLFAHQIREDGARGAALEIVLLEKLEKEDGERWNCLVRPGKKAGVGARFSVGEKMTAAIRKIADGGTRWISFDFDREKHTFFSLLDEIGIMPLPPYITEKLTDNSRYQTVYAEVSGSAAAPTAGLHFTPELLEKIREKGVEIAPVLLHVGLGTFRPVKTENIDEHKMHPEFYTIPPESAARIRRAKAEGRRIVAVGTTSCRTLEGSFARHGDIRADSGYTDIFLYPGCRFQVTDALITNFHLPESTLIMLVCALYGYERTMELYRYAVERRYRFFSFGDACLIL